MPSRSGVPVLIMRSISRELLFNGPGKEHDRSFFLLPVCPGALRDLIETAVWRRRVLQFNKDGSSVEMIGAEHSPGMRP